MSLYRRFLDWLNPFTEKAKQVPSAIQAEIDKILATAEKEAAALRSTHDVGALQRKADTDIAAIREWADMSAKLIQEAVARAVAEAQK